MLPGVDSYIASLIAVTIIIEYYFRHVDVLVMVLQLLTRNSLITLSLAFYIINTE